MWKNIRLIILVSFLIPFLSCHDREQNVDPRILANNDFRLFQETPAWELAKAVEDENEQGIYEILKGEPNMVNYQCPRYGETVLHLAASHHKLKSIECLLKSNADINIRDTENGDTPLNNACYASYAGDEGIKTIELLIEHGADVNVIEVTDSNKMPRSPLMSACYDGFWEGVVLLISKGADVNYIRNNVETALGESLVLGHYQIAYYLLQHGADYTRPIIQMKDTSGKRDGDIVRSVYIKEEMEKKKINYFTPEREYYYKIVDFLRDKGLSIKESGKRKFELSTFMKEIKDLRD